MTWQNWAGNQTCSPARTERPRSTEEVAAAVTRAVADGLRVRPLGSGHSFAPLALTDGVHLDLSGLAMMRGADTATGLVTVDAGLPLYRLNEALHHLGLALPNLGDIDRQTISGAVATGTHGTGARQLGLAAAVQAMQLVTAAGDVLRIDGSEPDLLAAAGVGLGALGVVTSLTVRCVPAFRLRAVEQPMPLGEVLEVFDDWCARHDHAEFHWFPHADRALTKRNDRVADDVPRRPVGRVRALVDDELLANGLFEVVNRVAARRPDWSPQINDVVSRALSARTYVDDSYAVFVSPRRVRFTEMEYAVPRARLLDALREIRTWIASHDERIAFPIEVRTAAADGSWLSTAYGRDTGYVAVHSYHRTAAGRYFAAVEAIMAEHEGRPHWGKLHGLGAEQLRSRHPRLDDFVAVRDRLDPDRVFGNDHLTRLLG